MDETNASTSQQPDKISWTASEFIAHEKSSGWYIALALAIFLLGVLIFWITKDAISVAVIVVGGLLLGVYGARQPRQLEYSVDSHSIHVGQKSFSYQEFRSFSVVPEGAFSSITFMPLKRFSPPLSIYYSPEDEAKIVNLLSSQLPVEPPSHDLVENLMRRIRF